MPKAAVVDLHHEVPERALRPGQLAEHRGAFLRRAEALGGPDPRAVALAGRGGHRPPGGLQIVDPELLLEVADPGQRGVVEPGGDGHRTAAVLVDLDVDVQIDLAARQHHDQCEHAEHEPVSTRVHGSTGEHEPGR